nr:hypothetical protein NNONMNKP_00132 [Oryctes rhinoceros nudivirus]
MLLSVNACKFKMFAVFIITLVFIVILVCIIVLYSNHRRYKYVRSERDEPPPSHNGEENSDAGSVYSDVLARLPQFRKFYNNYDKPTTSNDDDDAYIVEPVVPRIHKNVNLLPFDSIDRDDDYYAELEQDDAKMGHKTGNIADSVASGSINGDENDNDDEDVEMSDDEPLSNKSNTTTTTTTNTSVDKRVAGRSSISNPQTTTTISNATTSDNTTTQTSTNKPGIYPSLDKVTA